MISNSPDRASKQLILSSSARLVLLFSSIVVGLFMMPYLIHSLGEEQYGLWVIAGSIVAFYNLLDLGMMSAMQRFMMQSIYKEIRAEINLTLSANFVITSVVGLLAVIATLVIIVAAGTFVSDASRLSVFRVIVALLGMKAAFQFPLFSFYGVLMAKYRYHVISNIQLVSLIIRTGLIVSLIEGGYGLIGLGVATFIAELLGSIFIVLYAYRTDRKLQISIKGLTKRRFREYIDFGKYAYIIAVSNKVKESLDEVLVGWLVGLSAVTQYAIGAALIRYFESLIRSIFGVVSSVFNKYYVEERFDELRDVYLTVSEVATLIAFFVGFGLFLLGAEFISVWVGHGYLKSYYVLVILVISTAISSAEFSNIHVLMALGRHKQQAYVSTAEVLINLVLSLALGYKYGIYGVALGTTIPLTINSLFIRPIYTCNQIKVKLWDYYKIQLKISALAIVSMLLASVGKRFFEINSYIDIVIFGLVFTIIYFPLYVRYFMNKKVAKYMEEYINGRANGIYKFIRRG